MKPVELSEEQVLFFRARRGHLTGDGASTPAAAATSIIGGQAQQLPPALHALSLRTAGRPTAAAVTSALVHAPRSLVWTWGQRGTLHVYCARTDWACVVGARDDWGIDGRGGPVPTDAMLAKALGVVRKSDRAVTRGDMVGVAPKRYVDALADRAAMANMDADRLAASRLIWKLAHRGDLCLGENIGSERSYPARAEWHPKLAWNEPDSASAATTLARRYLQAYGAATPQDVAHFFGARVASARSWLATLESELTPVECGGRKELIALTADVDELRAPPPRGSGDWPVRLLPLWESMLMAHADKSWTVPDEADRKRVWRKAAYVAAVVLARGRVVGIWTQKKRAKHVALAVEPLSAWSAKKHGAAVKREAHALAEHLGVPEARVTLP